MFHKNVLNSLRSVSPQQVPESPRPSPSLVRLSLVPSGTTVVAKKNSSPFFDLIAITAHRCSSFFAEAAVLVLVLALLDRFMLKGRMELNWIVTAFTISVALLAASVLTEFSSRRWLQRH
jgi:general stress protein CsbA